MQLVGPIRNSGGAVTEIYSHTSALASTNDKVSRKIRTKVKVCAEASAEISIKAKVCAEASAEISTKAKFCADASAEISQVQKKQKNGTAVPKTTKKLSKTKGARATALKTLPPEYFEDSNESIKKKRKIKETIVDRSITGSIHHGDSIASVEGEKKKRKITGTDNSSEVKSFKRKPATATNKVKSSPIRTSTRILRNSTR